MSSGTAAATSNPLQPPSSGTNPNEGPDPTAATQGTSASTCTTQAPLDASLDDADMLQSSATAEHAALPEATQEVSMQSIGRLARASDEGVGYWQATWLYLTSLLRLGEAYEAAGSHEDAVHAFKEGSELVSTIASLLASEHMHRDMTLHT